MVSDFYFILLEYVRRKLFILSDLTNFYFSLHWFSRQETLSPGEQQRLCFARMILAEPTVAFLDESTCNVDEGMENAMYEMLRKVGPIFWL